MYGAKYFAPNVKNTSGATVNCPICEMEEGSSVEDPPVWKKPPVRRRVALALPQSAHHAGPQLEDEAAALTVSKEAEQEKKQMRGSKQAKKMVTGSKGSYQP